mgnify:CR=1 FL=1
MIAPGTIGTRAGPIRKPRPCRLSQSITPPGASSPKAEPPESATASTRVMTEAGSRTVVARVPGPPPVTVTAATAGSSASTTVVPVTRAWSKSPSSQSAWQLMHSVFGVWNTLGTPWHC